MSELPGLSKADPAVGSQGNLCHQRRPPQGNFQPTSSVSNVDTPTVSK
jgi:hypothetical protein